jgi:hypothetical protein
MRKNFTFLSKPFFHFLLLVIIMGACNLQDQKTNINSEDSSITVTPVLSMVEKPSYIVETWPEAEQILTMEEYETLLWYDATLPSICVVFDPFVLVERGEFLSTEEYLTRFRLEIDELIITELHYVFLPDTGGYDGPVDPDTGEPMYRVPDGWPYHLCFAATLGEGKHHATLIAQRTSGQELRYSWSFTIEKE